MSGLVSAVPGGLVGFSVRLQHAFRRLGSGLAIFVDAQHHRAGSYPASMFPEAASALIDAERKADFEEEGAHFESSYFLTLLYLPPAEDVARAESWLYEGKAQGGVNAREILRGFVDRTKSEEHTSELQSLMRISYADFCLIKNTKK